MRLYSLFKRNECGVLCKFDIEKTYDYVNWNFLLLVLQKKDFGEKLIAWLKWYISRARFSVLINDTLFGFFHNSSILRQGDPLSPYLFVNDMEALGCLIKRVVSGGFLLGCRMKGARW